MSNYDELLRKKENEDDFNDSSMEKHWSALEKAMDRPATRLQTNRRKILISAIAAAAVLFIAIFSYPFLKNTEELPAKTDGATVTRSAIRPPLNGTNVPYETFRFNATTGDTLFTLNGSIIIFPRNAVMNRKGEIINGDIEIRTREFNDVFDYSIAGIPMDYDSAGTKYKFISSGMIEIIAYKHGEVLQVNPQAKPQLNLVSTNKEQNTNLYRLDTVSGRWIYKGNEAVNLVGSIPAATAMTKKEPETAVGDVESADSLMPMPPQEASPGKSFINVTIDPASFKELLVYDGLKFEVVGTQAVSPMEDSKVEWNNMELIRGEQAGTYKVVFSAGTRKAMYTVKPVLEGKDFAEAEKLYQQKLKNYTSLKTQRKKREEKIEKENMVVLAEDKRINELNKLVELRNRFVEAENKKYDESIRRRDSTIKAKNDQQALGAQINRTGALQRDLIRSFEIDGFGYWNCDQPTVLQTQEYVGNFKAGQNQAIIYHTLCIAVDGINRIQNYYNSNHIGLIPNSSYFGWAFSGDQLYYFTRNDFKKAVVTNNPNTISIAMTLYPGDLKKYDELKGYLFSVK